MKERKGFSKTSLIIIVAIILIIIPIVIIIKQGNENSKLEGENKNNYETNMDGSKINISEEVSKEQKVGNILIEKSSIVYENGISKLTSKVTNDNIEKESLKFTIKFIDNNNEIIAESVGLVGKIKSGETKYISSNITSDVTNAKSIIYEIQN